jgi:ADP-ribosylglycohydrolase
VAKPNADHFAGCLIGQAVGDAMGFVVEGHPQDSCEVFVNEALRRRKLEGYSRGRFRIGQYSDDTQLARELVLSLIECGGFQPGDYAARIASLFSDNRVVGRGLATERAATRIARGIPWDQSGTPPPAAGNGSAMRAAPVGLLFWHDTTKMLSVAHDQGRITHTDPRCSAGAIAIAGAVGLVLRGDDLDTSALCDQLAAWTHAFDSELSESAQSLANIATPAAGTGGRLDRASWLAA